MIYYGKCGCGWGYTDYPFMSCVKCGYIGCGSKEELEKARKEGKLIKWTQKRPKDIPSSEIKDWCVPEYSFDEEEPSLEEQFLEEWDEWNY